jgi:metal-responsive CopG/Arc/MetJ family transcriptional regulator
MTTQKPQVLLTLNDELLKQIEDFRFEKRINSRSEAIRQLIETGLATSKPKAKKK